MTYYKISPALAKQMELTVETYLNDPQRPRLSPEVAARYTDYVYRLAEDSETPLLVRSGSPEVKGTWFVREGRKIIYVDNSPAQWMWRWAEEHPGGSYEELRAALVNYQIPAAMVPSTTARKHPNFTGMPALSPETGINSFDLELAHIKPIKLQGRFKTASLAAFKDHFKRFLAVDNLLPVPKNTGLNGMVDWYFNRRSLASN